MKNRNLDGKSLSDVHRFTGIASNVVLGMRRPLRSNSRRRELPRRMWTESSTNLSGSEADGVYPREESQSLAHQLRSVPDPEFIF